MTLHSIKIEPTSYYRDKTLIIRFTYDKSDVLDMLKSLSVPSEYLDEFAEIFSKVLTYDYDYESSILSALRTDDVKNIVIMGEPFASDRVKEIYHLVADIKKENRKVRMFLCTGYSFDDLASRSLVAQLDEDYIGNILYTSTGLYDKRLYSNGDGMFIDLQKTLREAKIIRKEYNTL